MVLPVDGKSLCDTHFFLFCFEIKMAFHGPCLLLWYHICLRIICRCMHCHDTSLELGFECRTLQLVDSVSLFSNDVAYVYFSCMISCQMRLEKLESGQLA